MNSPSNITRGNHAPAPPLRQPDCIRRPGTARTLPASREWRGSLEEIAHGAGQGRAGEAVRNTCRGGGAVLNRTKLSELRKPGRRKRGSDRGATCLSMVIGTLIIAAGLILLDQAWPVANHTNFWRLLAGFGLSGF